MDGKLGMFHSNNGYVDFEKIAYNSANLLFSWLNYRNFTSNKNFLITFISCNFTSTNANLVCKLWKFYRSHPSAGNKISHPSFPIVLLVTWWTDDHMTMLAYHKCPCIMFLVEKHPEKHPENVSFMQLFWNYGWFHTKWFTGLLELVQLYKQNPLQKFFVFTIYQNLTLALIFRHKARGFIEFDVFVHKRPLKYFWTDKASISINFKVNFNCYRSFRIW